MSDFYDIDCKYKSEYLLYPPLPGLTQHFWKKWDTLHGTSEYLQVEYSKSGKNNNSEIPFNLGLYLDNKIPLLSPPKWHAKYLDLFRPDSVSVYVSTCIDEMSRHFACHFGPLRSGILKIRTKCQIPEGLSIRALF
jgi:hypothetical protein